MILDKELVVIDLEATGTWIEKDKIIEIGMIKRLPDGTEIEYLQRVNPGISISDIITEITGMSDVDVKDSPSFSDIAKDVVEFIGNADLAGFNLARFDIPLLCRELESCGKTLDLSNRFIYDTQKIYHIHERRDLTAAYKFFCNKELIGAHSALVDSRATLEVLEEQIAKYGKRDKINTLQEFDYKQSPEFFDDSRKFRWWNKELYITFGKHNGKSMQAIAEEDRNYLQWILGKDFSNQVKSMVRDVLDGDIPTNGD